MNVHNCRIIDLHSVADDRGKLTVCEWQRNQWPFVPQRVFFVHGVLPGNKRGEHAHRECQQLLACISGSIKVLVDDGQARQEFVLGDNGKGLFVPAGIWSTQTYESPNSVLAVFASHEYEEEEYIRNYQQFMEFRQLP